MLSVRNISAGYGANTVLKNVSLRVDAGESVALLGPNGGGKTTLLRCITGTLSPGQGEIFLQGRNSNALNRRERARLVSVMPQRAFCPSGLTVRRMVLLGRYPWLSWLGNYRRRDYDAVDEALALTGAEELAARPVGELSGGELQRVLLARALAQKSPLLLLDELSAGLDLAHMVELFNLLEERRRNGMSLLMVMHDCNLATLYATRIVGLKNGSVLFDGLVEDIFTKENLGALYDIPIRLAPCPGLAAPLAMPAQALGPRAAGPGASLSADAAALRRH